MSSFRKTLAFLLLSALFAAKLGRSYSHSLLQRTAPGSEFDCTLTQTELRRFSSDEGRWIVTDSGLEALDGDLQALVNCTEEGDVLLFDVEAPVQPSRRVTIPWNLTLSSFVVNPQMENGSFPEAERKTTVLCPREDEGVFLVEANETLLANFIFQKCSLDYERGVAPYGIITTVNCSTSQTAGSIAFHHLEFETNSLRGTSALYVQEPSCSAIQIINLRFQTNSCSGPCAATLPSQSELRSITLIGNRFFEEDVMGPILILVYSGSNTTIDDLIASGNDGTTVFVENANLSISNSHIFQNSGGLDQDGYYTGGVTFLNSSGQILDSRFEGNTGTTGPSIAVENSSIVIARTTVVGCNATNRGAGIYLWRCPSVRILDSVFANNSAASYGGGVYSRDINNLQIENTTYGRTRFFRCEECHGQFINLLLVILAALILLGLTAFTIMSSLPAQRRSTNTKQLRCEEASTSSRFNRHAVEKPSAEIVPQEVINPHLGTRENNASTIGEQQQGKRNAELAKWIAVEIFKITINYLPALAIAIAVNVVMSNAL